MPPTTPPQRPELDFEEVRVALARVAAELEAIPVADLRRPNADPVHAASVVLGAVPGILAFRPEIVHHLPTFDLREVDRLSDYAKALWHLHTEASVEVETDALAPLLPEAWALRKRLVLWAQPLAAEGYLPSDLPARVRRRRTGVQQLAVDLATLALAFREASDALVGRCDITPADVDRAAELGPGLFAAHARRAHSEPGPRPSTIRYWQAWARMDKAYAECRRAITYLLGVGGDVDTVAPSFRGPRGRRRRRALKAAPAPAPPEG